MLCTLVLGASIGGFDFDFVLAACFLDLLVLTLDVFELHCLHLDDHCVTVDLPKVECFGQLVSVEFDQPHLEVVIDCYCLVFRAFFPAMESLTKDAAKASDKCLRASLFLIQISSAVDLTNLRLEALAHWLSV